jgi:hypothetical protein
VTSKTVSPEDRFKLNGYVSAIIDKSNFNRDRFASEIRRATSRKVVA